MGESPKLLLAIEIADAIFCAMREEQLPSDGFWNSDRPYYSLDEVVRFAMARNA